MNNYYFLFRSVTEAQKAMFLLKNHGIKATATGSTGILEGTGCVHTVKIAAPDFKLSLQLLRKNGIFFENIYRMAHNGRWEEVVR